MQGPAWINLFQQIPTSLHDTLLLMTTTGFEIVLQRLIRLDREYLVALGRLSGSTDQPKLLIIPYVQMTYLSFSKKMTDEEIDQVLIKPDAPAARASKGRGSASVREEPFDVIDFPKPAVKAALDAEAEAAAEEAAADDKNAGKAQPPSKTMLLARLRQRLADDIAKPPSNR